MKDLFIITTKARNLPPKCHGLFKDAQSIDKTDELNKLFDSPRSLWRLQEEEQLVFGTACLDTDNKKEWFNQKEKNDFVLAIITDVLKSLNKEEKAGIRHLFVIAHGFDLGYNQVSLMPVTDHDLLKDISWQGGLFPEKTKIEVHFLAFSHVNHALRRLLESGKPINDPNQPYDQQLKYFYEIVASWQEDIDWFKDWLKNDAEAEIEKVKHLKLKFQFKFRYATALAIAEAPPVDYPPYVNLQKEMQSALDGDGPLVNIVFTPLKEIAAFNDLTFYKNIIDTFFPIEKLKGNNVIDTLISVEELEEKANLNPVIFIGYKNIMSSPKKEETKANELDPRFRFLDSSIWYRYVAIENGFADNLEKILNTIGWAYHHNLYQKNVCREFVEFQNRLVLNSYLSDSFGDGHSLKVFPFRFHSESQMELKAMRNDVKFKHKQLTWNFLLIDDYAPLELREGDEKPSTSLSKHCKGNIIEALIASPPKPLYDNTPQSIDYRYFKTCTSIEEAKKTYFQEKKDLNNHNDNPQNEDKKSDEFLPDIILLDYLFSESGENQPQHYGTDLLQSIAKKESTHGRSVAQKYWIHPISVFNEAMLSEMQEQSYQHFEHDWYLARGADPINTPHLFRCSLFEFMDVQSEFLLFDQEELWNFLIDQDAKNEAAIKNNQNPKQNPLIKAAIKQKNALNAFKNFLEKFSADEGVDPNSAIGKSANAYMRDFEGRDTLELRDHLRKILFQFAYTSGFDFPAIEREFKQIDRIYRKYYAQNQGNPDPKMKEHLSKLKTAVDNLAEWTYDLSDKYS